MNRAEYGDYEVEMEVAGHRSRVRLRPRQSGAICVVEIVLEDGRRLPKHAVLYLSADAAADAARGSVTDWAATQ